MTRTAKFGRVSAFTIVCSPIIGVSAELCCEAKIVGADAWPGYGRLQSQASGATFHVWALTRIGNGEEGLAERRSGVDLYGAVSIVISDLFRAVLAEEELRAGNYEQAAVARRSGWEGGDNQDENPGVAASA